jgi:uncharacterized protein
VDIPDYDPAVASPPLADAELEALDRLLQTLPAAAMNVEVLDGYLTALALSPVPVAGRASATWMPAVWGGDGPPAGPFDSQRQRKKAALLVLRQLHAVDRALREDPDRWEPVFSVATDGDGTELADAEDWCIGFLQGVALDAEAWEPLFDGPETGHLLVPVALLGGDEEAFGPDERARLADAAGRDALSRAVADGIATLARHRFAPGTATMAD